MRRLLLIIAAAGFLSGCMGKGQGSLFGVRAFEPDAWMVSTVQANIDRSVLPEDAIIHSIDMQFRMEAAQYSPEQGRITTDVRNRGGSYTHFLGHGDLMRLSVESGGVAAGSHVLLRAYGSTHTYRYAGLTCVGDDNRPLPGVKRFRVDPGDVVYLGHAVLGVEITGQSLDGVTYPARLTSVQIVETPPAGLDALVRAEGLDPSRLKYVPNADAGCKPAGFTGG